MSYRQIKAGSVDQAVVLRIADSGDGTPETGVVFNTSGIDLWYRRTGAAKVSITEATLSALTDAHSDGGFLTISDGWYRLDLPDAAVASGVAGVQIGGTVTGMVVFAPYIELTVNTPDEVYSRLGAPAGASVSADIAAAKALLPTALVGGRMDSSVGAMAAGVLTNAAFAANAISDAKVDPDVTIASVTGAVGSVTGNVGGNVAGSVASVTADVGITQGGADKVWASAARSLTTFGSLVTDIATAVWAAATRLLTAGTNIVLAKGVGVTGFTDLSAAQVNAEADTALADYDAPTKAELDSAHATTDGLITTVDSVVDGIAAKTTNLPVDPADQSLIIAATDAIINAIAALNNLSSAQAQTAAAAALTAYDPPTKAELDTAAALLATAANLTAAKAVVDAIKLKTDPLTFTVANVLDANIQRINDVALVGTGVLGDEWDAA